MPRRAAIDVGSNTIRLLVVEGESADALRIVHEEQVVTRLGQGLAEGHSLNPEAWTRTLAAVRRFAETARAHGAEDVEMVGTGALRQTRDRDRFVRAVREATGLRLRVISGQEEARLALLGARWGARIPTRFLLMDIGGGSTELILADGDRMVIAESLSLGVVQLTERCLTRDPVAWDEYDDLSREIRSRLDVIEPRLTPSLPVPLVGTAGTVTTLAALDLALPSYDRERVQGHRLARGAVERLLRRLGSLPTGSRAELPCLEPGRADVIIAGVAICLAVLDLVRAEELIVSDVGLREGIILDRFREASRGGQRRRWAFFIGLL